jgi:hypothetical protein
VSVPTYGRCCERIILWQLTILEVEEDLIRQLVAFVFLRSLALLARIKETKTVRSGTGS